MRLTEDGHEVARRARASSPTSATSATTRNIAPNAVGHAAARRHPLGRALHAAAPAAGDARQFPTSSCTSARRRPSSWRELLDGALDLC